MFVAALDQTIMATAIPTIAAKLHSAAGYTWIGGAYLLANAAGACIWAKLSDIWGRKLILLVAVVWFFVSSIICATAVDMQMLIVGRALQGVAGGGLLQLVTIIISDLFSVRQELMEIYSYILAYKLIMLQTPKPISWTDGIHVGSGWWHWPASWRRIF